MTDTTHGPILSLDVPARYEGGWLLWHPKEDRFTLGTIRFDVSKPESSDYRALDSFLTTLSPRLIILEHPFLYSIAQYIGAVKLWAAQHDAFTHSLTAPGSKKAVLGHGNASKKDVMHWAIRWIADTKAFEENPQPLLTQHMADAALYFVAWRKGSHG